MPFARPNASDRIRAALIALAAEGAIGAALLYGLAIGFPRTAEQASLTLLAVEPPPPPVVRVAPSPRRSDRPSGQAAPAGRRSRATDLVVPKPVVASPDPPPVVAATIADSGVQATSGAADAGEGPGAGGEGNGRGSGGDGDGDGGGVAPRLVKGRIRNSDYPRGAGLAGAGGIVGVRYLVEVDGRVSDCEITRSSGNAELDDTTCRLIVERFRFRPSLDERGRPVPAYIVENHEWVVRGERP